jgi:hypothetical protein
MHLDNVSDAQRQLGAAMVLHRARHEAGARPGVPVLVTGDLNRCETSDSPFRKRISDGGLGFGDTVLSHPYNSQASGSDGAAYAVLTGMKSAPAVPDEFSRRFPLPPLSSSPNISSSSSIGEKKEEELVMRDFRDAAPRGFVGGPWATFTGFDNRKADEECVDFVFGRSDGGWCVPLPFIVFKGVDDYVIGKRSTYMSRPH